MVYTVDGVNYTRRKKIPVTGAGSGAQSDFQINLTALWENAIQADYDDVRFTQSDMQTLIDAWMESKTDSTTADIWVEFPTTPADGVVKTEAYMYYGNAAVASDWDGPATFLQYHGSASANFLDALVVQYSSVAYRARIKMNAATHTVQWGLQKDAGSNDDGLMFQSYTPTNLRYSWSKDGVNSTTKSETPSLPNGTWCITEITNDGTSVYGYVDDDVIGSGAITTNLPNENMGLWLRIATGTAEQEWSFARKYVASPPTYAFGAEEHQRRTPMMM